MKTILVVLMFAMASWAQNPSNANIVVVGNEAQPVQFTHKSNIQNAITRAGVGGMVIIPADYPFPSETFTNPNGIVIIDLRKNTFGLWPSGTYSGTLELLGGNLLLGYSTITNYYLNSPSGTVCNNLAKIDTTGVGFNGKAVQTVGGESSIIGVAVANCATTGTVAVATGGQVQVIFDNAAATVGHFVEISATAGLASDAGATQGANQIGQLILTPAGALPSGCNAAPGCWVQLQLGGSGGGGGGSANAVVTNPALTVTNTIQPTATSVVPITAKCPAGAAATDSCGKIQDNTGADVLNCKQNGSCVIGSGSTKSLGSGIAGNSDLDGTLTMSGGTATYTFTGTYSSHPTCTASDETSIAAVKITYSGTTSVTFTTAGATDVVDYHCLGRN